MLATVGHNLESIVHAIQSGLVAVGHSIRSAIHVVEWGTAPAWATAIVGLFGLRKLGAEVKKLSLDRRNAIDANAHKVCAELTTKDLVDLDGDPRTVDEYTFHNNGDEPIFGARAIRAAHREGATEGTDIRGDVVSVIPPKSTIVQRQGRVPGYVYSDIFSITFDDSRGNHWKRDRWGALTKIPVTGAGLHIGVDKKGEPIKQAEEREAVNY